jgi:hypothetical protein
VYLDTGVVETNCHAREVLLGHLRHVTINLSDVDFLKVITV